jgi:hypothetical protein
MDLLKRDRRLCRDLLLDNTSQDCICFIANMLKIQGDCEVRQFCVVFSLTLGR